MKTQLTKEQSQHLIDLGVPKEKASGIIQECVVDEYYPSYLDRPKRKTAQVSRIFKLKDFLNGEILPKIIDFGRGHCPLTIKYIDINDNIHAVVHYAPAYDFPTYLSPSPRYFKEELIDALYQLACWYYGEYLKSKEK